MSFNEIHILITDNWWLSLLDFFQRFVNFVGDNWSILLGVSIPVLLGLLLLKVVL